MSRRGRRSPRGRRVDGAPAWAWMLLGLAIGLTVALGVYLSDAGPGPRSVPRQAVVPRVQPAEPAAPRPEEPPGTHFDFYELLPKFEVVIPELESQVRPDNRPVPVQESGHYVLQAGSFREHADADRMQATLALLGIESRIQRVTIDDDVFHRVRVGPISNLDELNRIRSRLREREIEILLMKVPQ